MLGMTHGSRKSRKSRISQTGRAVAGCGLLLAAAVAWAAAVDEPPQGAPSATQPPRRVHASASGVVERVLGATRAFLAEDGAAARVELDALKRESPPLDRDRDAVYGWEILSYDQAFHTTIDRAREYALAGRVADSFNQFVWVERACVTCHGMARTKGLLAPPASSASPADSGSPTRSSAPTPSR